MIKGFSSSQKTGLQKYATIQPLGAGKYGTEVLPKALTEVLLVDQVPEAGSTENTIVLTGHAVLPGDILRFNGGNLDYQEVTVESVTANTITLAHKFDQPITPADTFRFLRTVTLTISKEGNLATSSGPVQFVRDGSATQVLEDTVTPANNLPLPVKLSGITGDVNITANDLNVQLQHNAANPDSTQVGDGTNILLMNASGEATTRDADAITELQNLVTALAENNKTIHRVGGSFTASAALSSTRTSIATVAASRVGTEIEISYKNGDAIALYDASTAGNLLGYVSSGGGVVKLNDLAAATQIYAEPAGADFTATDLMVNLNGKDA